MFVAIISLTSMILLNYCEPKIEISSSNIVQVRNTLKIIKLYTKQIVHVFNFSIKLKKTFELTEESVIAFLRYRKSELMFYIFHLT